MKFMRLTSKLFIFISSMVKRKAIYVNVDVLVIAWVHDNINSEGISNEMICNNVRRLFSLVLALMKRAK